MLHRINRGQQRTTNDNGNNITVSNLKFNYFYIEKH